MDTYEYNSTGYDEIGLLTPHDIAFIHTHVAEAGENLDEVTRRINHPETRQSILDNTNLFDAVITGCKKLNISEYFYYWVIVRKGMIEAGLPELVYTENVALSMVKMAFFQRETLDRDIDLESRYFPVRLSVLIVDEAEGKRVKITSSIEPFQMVIEGFQTINEESECMPPDLQ